MPEREGLIQREHRRHPPESIPAEIQWPWTSLVGDRILEPRQETRGGSQRAPEIRPSPPLASGSPNQFPRASSPPRSRRPVRSGRTRSTNRATRVRPAGGALL